MPKHSPRPEISASPVWESITANFNDELPEFMTNTYEFDMGAVSCFRR
ncbi:Uncharacterised protein [Vibrio cholerae]|nr:Uncharacterised protein [Vibrio cholerae]